MLGEPAAPDNVMTDLQPVRGTAVVVAALVLSSIAFGQQPQGPPVFRGGVAFVNVDVYPRQNGRMVEGLTAENFQVFEDGKPQSIENFEFIRVAPNVPVEERRDPNTKEEGDALAADPHTRVFVIFLDLYHISLGAAHDARQPLLDFVNRTLGADDLFGVVTPEVPPRSMVLARRTDVLERDLLNSFDWALGGDRTTFAPRTAAEEQLYMCEDGDDLIRLHREDMLTSTLAELTVYLGTLRDERKNLVLVSEGWDVHPRPARAPERLPQLPHIPVGANGRIGGDTPVNGSSNADWCSRQANRLNSIDFEYRFKDLLVAAQRANVSVFPVDVGGLKTFAPTASMRGVPNAAAMRRTGEMKIEVLRTLAENTNGRAIVNTNGLSAGFRQIAEDLSAYYLLGYSSTNAAADGKYRAIEVKVNRPGVSLTARHGYFAPAAAKSASPAASAGAATAPPDVVEVLARIRSGNEARAETAVAVTGPSLGAPTWFVGPSSKPPVEQTTRSVFSRTERIRVEWPRVQAAQAPVARILDRRGQPLRISVAVTEAADDRGARLVVDLPLASFAEGDYVLELTANAGLPASSRSLVGFRVTR
jgi:VWFA-related protein